MELTTATTAQVTAKIGDMSRTFETQEAADAWIALIRNRFWHLEQIGVIKLVNSHDKRWGRNGHEHMGRDREPGRTCIESLRRVFQRAGGYVGKWLTLRDDTFPLDLEGKIRDMRYACRASYPHPAAKAPSNIHFPSSWWVGDDGYYWHYGPDVILVASFDDWEPI